MGKEIATGSVAQCDGTLCLHSRVLPLCSGLLAALEQYGHGWPRNRGIRFDSLTESAEVGPKAAPPHPPSHIRELSHSQKCENKVNNKTA